MRHIPDALGDKLRPFVCGQLAVEDNGAENGIRPLVIGRKNGLFSHSVNGINASANLYSLIETAKANGLEP